MAELRIDSCSPRLSSVLLKEAPVCASSLYLRNAETFAKIDPFLTLLQKFPFMYSPTNWWVK